MYSISRRRLLASLAAAATVPAVLKIGLSMPLSGGAAVNVANRSATPDSGLDFLAGFQQAVRLERRGLPIEVIELNDEFDPARAAANVEALAQRDVVAISGLWTTAHAAAALPIASRLRVPVIGMRSGAPELRRGDNPWAFHLKASEHDELQAVLKTLTNMNVPRVGVLYTDDARNRGLMKLVQSSGASISRAIAVKPDDKAALLASVRELVGTAGTQSILLLMGTEAVVDAMMELRGRDSVFFAPVCTLSHVITNSFAESRERSLTGLCVASPFSNPAFSRSDVAGRFREAMLERDLDALTKSFSAFEGFIYGSTITRTLVAMKGVATRETLAAALRSRPTNLGGLPVKFDERQVGYQAVHLLYKLSAEGTLKA